MRTHCAPVTLATPACGTTDRPPPKATLKVVAARTNGNCYAINEETGGARTGLCKVLSARGCRGLRVVISRMRLGNYPQRDSAQRAAEKRTSGPCARAPRTAMSLFIRRLG
jgi:hypothetical protein